MYSLIKTKGNQSAVSPASHLGGVFFKASRSRQTGNANADSLCPTQLPFSLSCGP